MGGEVTAAKPTPPQQMRHRVTACWDFYWRHCWEWPRSSEFRRCLIRCSGDIWFFLLFFFFKGKLQLWHINSLCNEWLNVSADREITKREVLHVWVWARRGEAFPSVWQQRFLVWHWHRCCAVARTRRDSRCPNADWNAFWIRKMKQRWSGHYAAES